MQTARILLVDDVKIFLEFERGVFERAGCAVITASSGEEAVRLARAEKPHVVLLDYEMPGMKGDDACRRIREDPATRHIPVLIVTSHPSPQVAAACDRAGATDLVAKPVEAKDLMLRVLKLLQIPYRVDYRARVEMEIAADGGAGSGAALGYSVDLSEGGMLLSTPEPLAPGTSLALSFRLPGEEGRVTARAVVLRSTAERADRGFAVALRFEGMDPQSRARIRAFVEREIGG